MVEYYRDDTLRYYKNQIDNFKKLKQKTENIDWNDKVYEKVIGQLNLRLYEVAKAISIISDGSSVRIIDDFLNDVMDYVKTSQNYSK